MVEDGNIVDIYKFMNDTNLVEMGLFVKGGQELI